LPETLPRASSGRTLSAAIECIPLDAAGGADARSGSSCSPRYREQRELPLQVAPVAAMDARVVVGAPVAEETSAATAVAVTATRGVATPSPVPSVPATVATTAAGNGGGSGVVASTSCTPQNPVVVVASSSGNHQPAGVPVAARILSRNVNGTRKSPSFVVTTLGIESLVQRGFLSIFVLNFRLYYF